MSFRTKIVQQFFVAPILAALLTIGTTPANAGDLKISFKDKKGNLFTIGTLEIEKTDAGEKFKVVMDETKFTNHFLNMFPFKCIEGKQWLCHLPYPHKTKGIITKDNMMDLEYALLFLHKDPAEYGINFWNGVYYKLTRQNDGGFKGILMETDMNVLAVPPEKEYGRPINHVDLIESQPKDHRFPELLIKP